MRARLWTILLLTPLLLAGMCDDDSPTRLRPRTPDPTLDNVWPNADGTSWTYQMHELIWYGEWYGEDFIYDTPEEVPPAPSLDEVAALLDYHPHGDVVSQDLGSYILQFNGEITTESGVTAQNLVETLDWSGQPAPVPRAAGDALLARILAARPDLRARAVQRGLRAAADEPSTRDLLGPLFLNGYAWEKTSEHIGSYGDLDQLLAWKYLEADLTVGHEFSLQLIPELADDIWLHARILSAGSAGTQAGRSRQTVTCLYEVDYGVSAITTGGGEIVGYERMIDYGTIKYAPEIGPVESYERKLVAVGVSGVGEGFGELELTLTGVDLGP